MVTDVTDIKDLELSGISVGGYPSWFEAINEI